MRAYLAGAALTALAGCASAPPAPEPAEAVQQAWVQAVAGPGWAVRVLTAAPACPTAQWAGGSAPMTQRGAPGDEPAPARAKQADRKASRFVLRACELTWPTGAAQVQVAGINLRAPVEAPRRIAVVGDSGCRLKASEQALQSCKDGPDWPFASVLAQVAAQQPDLVVHVGDYHYRESPCPASEPGCAGSPWGYGDDAWQADFFQPAAKLLAAAPWVFVRGNHEACSRAGQGWLRYLDALPGTARVCGPGTAGVDPSDMTKPFTVPLSPRRQLIVFDTSELGSKAPAEGSAAWSEWTLQLAQVAALTRGVDDNVFLSHHPSLALALTPDGAPALSNSGLTPLLLATQPGRLFAPGIGMTVHGHLHTSEALGFATGQPVTLVAGNAGSATHGHVDAAQATGFEPLPGARLQTVAAHQRFGFTLLTAQDAGWLIEAFDVAGQLIYRCHTENGKLGC